MDPRAKYGAWTTGLCGCFQDLNSCCCGWCCPCVLVGRIVETIDQGAISCKTGCCTFCLLQSFTGCGCFYTFGYRAKLRNKYGLPAEPCGDLCTDCCCLGCSICQVYRELQKRLGSLDKGCMLACIWQVTDRKSQRNLRKIRSMLYSSVTGFSPSIKERYEAPTQTVYERPAVYDEAPQEQTMSQNDHEH